MADGKIDNVSTVRSWVAHSDVTIQQMHDLFSQVWGRRSSDESDMPWINSIINGMANGYKAGDGQLYDLAEARRELVDIGKSGHNFDQIIQDVQGRSPTLSDQAYLNWVINSLSDGTLTYDGAVADLAQSAATHTILENMAHSILGTPSNITLSTDVEQTLNNYQKQLATAKNNTNTFAQIRSEFVHTQYVANSISGIYNTKFGYTPTINQLNYWENQLDTLGSRQGIINGIAHSVESKNMITSFYKSMFGISPADSQIEYWQNQLQNVGTRQALMLGLSQSNEATFAIEGDYKLITGQNISAQNLNTYQQELAVDGNQNRIIAQIINSPEASQQINGYIHDAYYEDATPQQLENGKEIFSGIATITQQAADTIQVQAMNLQQTTGHVDGAQLQASLTAHPADSIVQRLYDDATNLGSDIIKRFNALTPEEKAEVIGDVAQLLLLAVNPNKLQAVIQAGRAGYDLYETFTQDHSGADILRSVGEPKGTLPSDPNATSLQDVFTKGQSDLTLRNGEKITEQDMVNQWVEHAEERGHLNGNPSDPTAPKDPRPLSEVGLKTPEDLKNYYQQLKNSFNDPNSHIEHTVGRGQNGSERVLFWDNDKGIFTAFNDGGKNIGTSFRPVDGKDYYFTQVSKLKN